MSTDKRLLLKKNLFFFLEVQVEYAYRRFLSRTTQYPLCVVATLHGLAYACVTLLNPIVQKSSVLAINIIVTLVLIGIAIINAFVCIYLPKRWKEQEKVQDIHHEQSSEENAPSTEGSAALRSIRESRSTSTVNKGCISTSEVIQGFSSQVQALNQTVSHHFDDIEITEFVDTGNHIIAGNTLAKPTDGLLYVPVIEIPKETKEKVSIRMVTSLTADQARKLVEFDAEAPLIEKLAEHYLREEGNRHVSNDRVKKTTQSLMVSAFTAESRDEPGIQERRQSLFFPALESQSVH